MKLPRLLSYLPTVLAALTAGILWQIMVTATGVSRSTTWVIAFVLVIGGIVGGAGALLVRARPLSRPMTVPARVAPLVPRAAGWRFDEAAPIVADPFVDVVIREGRPAIERALLEVFENPLASPREVTNGEVVYIQRVDAGKPPNESTPPTPALLLGYAATQRDRVIRILGVSRAANAPAEDAEALAALQRVTETVVARAHGKRHTPVADC
jgi:hypothetical protein